MTLVLPNMIGRFPAPQTGIRFSIGGISSDNKPMIENGRTLGAYALAATLFKALGVLGFLPGLQKV